MEMSNSEDGGVSTRPLSRYRVDAVLIRVEKQHGLGCRIEPGQFACGFRFMSRNYKKLHVYQQTRDLAVAVYQATQNFPKSEMFGITSQLRRAALSVPTNIVEGSHRFSRADYVRFLDMALGSLAETGFLIEFATGLGYLDTKTADELQSLQASCIRQLQSLINSHRKALKSSQDS